LTSLLTACASQSFPQAHNQSKVFGGYFEESGIFGAYRVYADVGAADGVSLSVGSLIYENLAAFSSGAVLTHVIFAASSARRECHLKLSS